MSMPTFPENGIELTKEQALHMLLGSIAMEELALSHIMNAEGEKLQYILGTLPENCLERSQSTTTCELLEVNRSVTEMLDHINQTQMLLKGKLSQVLEAMKCQNNCHSYSPCSQCYKACNCCEKNCCNRCIMETCVFKSAGSYNIKNGNRFIWKPEHCSSLFCIWNADSPSKISLNCERDLLITCFIQASSNDAVATSVVLQTLKNGICSDILSLDTRSNTDFNLSGSVLLSGKDYKSIDTQVILTLRKPSGIFLKGATLIITQL